LISVFVEGCGQVLETCWIAVGDEHFHSVVLSGGLLFVGWVGLTLYQRA
jgi:hypothetical protein